MTVPVCVRCKRISVLSPCRACCTPAELEKLPEAPVEQRRLRTVTVEEATA